MNIEKLMGSGMNCDTYESDSTKVDNELFNLFTTELNNYVKLFPASLLIVIIIPIQFYFV